MVTNLIPIIKGELYGIDIETSPLPQYITDIKSSKIKKVPISDDESDEDDKIDLDKAGLLPWTSRIIGLGVCWGDEFELDTAYFHTQEDILSVIKTLSTNNIKLCGHNIFFDWSHLYYHYELPLNFVHDSGVCSQAINNSDFIYSFGLKQTISRLYNVLTQEVEVQDYLRINHKVSESQYGKYLYLVPHDILSKYCKLDAYYTRKIVLDSPQWLKSDLSVYTKLYIHEVKFTIQQFLEGILVDREGMIKESNIVQSQIDDIENQFFSNEELKPYIELVQKDKFNIAQAKYKKKILDYDEFNKSCKFNIGSRAQLKQLFDAQKLFWNENKGKFEYPFLTDKPGTKIKNPDSPKLGAKFLPVYGVGGKILANRGELVTLKQHIDRALDESQLTGKIHAHINLLGTKTGRISGSGVNIIATPISDVRYGKYLIVEEGWSIMAKDVVSLEPTIFACLSDDPLLKYACYEGEGKEPFLKDGTLWIDDIYLMACYAAPFMRNELMDKLDLTNWVKDADSEKKKVKHLRSVAKTIVLATNYGAAPGKIKSTLLEQLKLDVPVSNIKLFQDSYWDTIAIAAQYKRSLEREAKTTGYFINIGGFPLTFYDTPACARIMGEHKALNKMLQSSASVCLKLLLYFIWPIVRKRDDVIPLICDWHDAIFFKVKNESITEINTLFEQALVEVNKTLNLPLNLRLDFKFGRSFYDCK